MCNVIFFMVLVNVEVQTDWVSGPGVLGPVNSWDAFFYQSDSVTYNIQGQISPVASDVNYTAWVKHIVSQDGNIGGANSLVSGDFDNDGDPDLVGAKGGANTIVFYENQGDTFVQVSSFAAPGGGQAWISVNYINSDSLIDVVVSGSSGMSWFENLGGFNFIQHIISSGTDYGFVETGDVDNDNDIDIVNGGSGTGGPIQIWKNDGMGNFVNTQTISHNKWRLRFDDLDGDNDLDLIDAHYPTGTFIYFNDGTGNFAQVASLNSSGVDAMWSRDFDNDGDQDVLTGEFLSGSNYVRWWENDGTGMNYTPHTMYSGTSWWYGDGAFAEDMNMDGKVDGVSGYVRLAWFRQITLNNFIEYVIDAALPQDAHWIYPLYRGMCFIGVDVLVSCYAYFLWYENQMVNQFADSSWLESSVLNSQCDADWLWFGYDVCCPFDSAIGFQFRSGKDSSEIVNNPWSTPVFLPGFGYFVDSVDLAPYTTSGDTLFQYKVNFTGTQDAPIVYEVWVEWECGGGGIEENAKYKIQNAKLEVYGNKIYYSLARETNISLSLYDISGHLVKLLEQGRKSEGKHEVSIPCLRNGAYFVSLNSKQRRVTKKFIVLH